MTAFIMLQGVQGNFNYTDKNNHKANSHDITFEDMRPRNIAEAVR